MSEDTACTCERQESFNFDRSLVVEGTGRRDPNCPEHGAYISCRHGDRLADRPCGACIMEKAMLGMK